VLPQILARQSALPVETASDHAQLERGRVYVAPPDRHVLVRRTGLRVSRGPRENGFRPAIDPLFRTAARSHGPRTVGVILSGALDDGSFGLTAIVRRGGAAIVQDPDEAEVPGMPLSALRQTPVDYVLPARDIAAAIVELCREPAQPEEEGPMPKPDEPEPQRRIASLQVADMTERLGAPSGLTCPACGGALWETTDGPVVRFACHVGHQYGPESLLTEHSEAVEQALWSAVRILEQHAELRQRLARRAESAGQGLVAANFQEDSRDYHAHAQSIRRLVFGEGEERPPAESVRRKTRAR
jgi:two-component system chemotaxis response regulator CheB